MRATCPWPPADDSSQERRRCVPQNSMDTHLAAPRAEIKIKNILTPRIWAGTGPQPTISKGKWQSGPSPGDTPRERGPRQKLRIILSKARRRLFYTMICKTPGQRGQVRVSIWTQQSPRKATFSGLDIPHAARTRNRRTVHSPFPTMRSISEAGVRKCPKKHVYDNLHLEFVMVKP
jgi:hypothetical protein